MRVLSQGPGYKIIDYDSSGKSVPTLLSLISNLSALRNATVAADPFTNAVHTRPAPKYQGSSKLLNTSAKFRVPNPKAFAKQAAVVQIKLWNDYVSNVVKRSASQGYLLGTDFDRINALIHLIKTSDRQDIMARFETFKKALSYDLVTEAYSFPAGKIVTTSLSSKTLILIPQFINKLETRNTYYVNPGFNLGFNFGGSKFSRERASSLSWDDGLENGRVPKDTKPDLRIKPTLVATPTATREEVRPVLVEIEERLSMCVDRLAGLVALGSVNNETTKRSMDQCVESIRQYTPVISKLNELLEKVVAVGTIGEAGQVQIIDAIHRLCDVYRETASNATGELIYTLAGSRTVPGVVVEDNLGMGAQVARCTRVIREMGGHLSSAVDLAQKFIRHEVTENNVIGTLNAISDALDATRERLSSGLRCHSMGSSVMESPVDCWNLVIAKLKEKKPRLSELIKEVSTNVKGDESFWRILNHLSRYYDSEMQYASKQSAHYKATLAGGQWPDETLTNLRSELRKAVLRTRLLVSAIEALASPNPNPHLRFYGLAVATRSALTFDGDNNVHPHIADFHRLLLGSLSCFKGEDSSLNTLNDCLQSLATADLRKMPSNYVRPYNNAMISTLGGIVHHLDRTYDKKNTAREIAEIEGLTREALSWMKS